MPFIPELSFSEPTPIESHEEEIDIRYKKQIPLYLQHDLGDVTLQGWNQDLIRVRMIKKIQTTSADESRLLFKQFSLISLETPKTIELRIGSPQGTDLLNKLKSRQQRSKIRVDLEIRAPATMDLSMLLGEGRTLKLNHWRGKTTFQGLKNTLDFYKVRVKAPVNLNCVDCKLSVLDSELSGNFILGDQPVQFKKTMASKGSVHVYLKKGSLELEDTKGHFQIRQENSSLISRSHQGSIQALQGSGQTQFSDFEGDLDLQGGSSEYKIHVKKLSRHLQVKNQEGAIEISMPHRFCGEVSLQSIQGDVLAEFPIQNLPNSEAGKYGPEIKGKISGITCSPASGMLEAHSDLGIIQLKQREILQ